MTVTVHHHMLDECTGPCPLDCGHKTGGTKLVEHLERPDLLGVHILLLISMLQELKDSVDENKMDIDGEDIVRRSRFDEMHSLLSRMLELEAKTETVERDLVREYFWDYAVISMSFHVTASLIGQSDHA